MDTSRAVVSQSSVKFGKKRVLLVGATNFMTITAEVATSKLILAGGSKISRNV